MVLCNRQNTFLRAVFKAFSEKVDRLSRFENAAKQRVKEVRYFNKKPKRFRAHAGQLCRSFPKSRGLGLRPL